eukprot:gene13376-19222_t
MKEAHKTQLLYSRSQEKKVELEKVVQERRREIQLRTSTNLVHSRNLRSAQVVRRGHERAEKAQDFYERKFTHISANIQQDFYERKFTHISANIQQDFYERKFTHISANIQQNLLRENNIKRQKEAQVRDLLHQHECNKELYTEFWSKELERQAAIKNEVPEVRPNVQVALEKMSKPRKAASARVSTVGNTIGLGTVGSTIGLGTVGSTIGLGTVGSTIGLGTLGSTIGFGTVGSTIGLGTVGSTIGSGTVGSTIGLGTVGGTIGLGTVGGTIGLGTVGSAIGLCTVGSTIGLCTVGSTIGLGTVGSTIGLGTGHVELKAWVGVEVSWSTNRDTSTSQGHVE